MSDSIDNQLIDNYMWAVRSGVFAELQGSATDEVKAELKQKQTRKLLVDYIAKLESQQQAQPKLRPEWVMIGKRIIPLHSSLGLWFHLHDDGDIAIYSTDGGDIDFLEGDDAAAFMAAISKYVIK